MGKKDPYNDLYAKKVDEYMDKFNVTYPSMTLRGISEADQINLINKAIKDNKEIVTRFSNKNKDLT